MKTVYISVGNSDDRLSQWDWSAFVSSVNVDVRDHAEKVHGFWLSPSSSPWQNACWCIEIDDEQDEYSQLRHVLRGRAYQYRQGSIAWAEVVETEFLKAP